MHLRLVLRGFFILAFGFCGVYKAFAVEAADCGAWLADIKPSFDLDLEIDSKRLLVSYKQNIFPVTLNQLILLRQIIGAPNEVAALSDVLHSLWGSQEPEYAEACVQNLLTKLRNKFRDVETDFDKLKSEYRVGPYWKREFHQQITRGRVAVAKYISEGYADKKPIGLRPAEHAILMALVKFGLVSASSVPQMSSRSFPSRISILNKKFKSVLGVNLVRPGPFGLGQTFLNENVSVEP